MANKEAKYDKVLLIVSAFAALAGSGYLYVLKSGFAETLVQPKVTPKNELGEVPIEQIKEALAKLQQTYNWKAPVRQNKPVPLNKSVTVIQRGGELVDLFVENPLLRPPMSNQYLRDNDLDYLSPNVGDLDPDDDGFTNLEEFTKKTNPKDASSHPPATEHLYFKERIENKYVLALQSSNMPVQVKRLEPPPAGSTFIDVLPKEFGFDKGATTLRFSALAFERKVVADKDVSELTVLDKATNQKVALVLKVPMNLAEYLVKLEFRTRSVTELTVKKGENFRLPGVPATFQVLDVVEDNATIAELKSDNSIGLKFVVNKRP